MKSFLSRRMWVHVVVMGPWGCWRGAQAGRQSDGGRAHWRAPCNNVGWGGNGCGGRVDLRARNVRLQAQ
eukprot:9150557-Prorocentrum_lima.AAC.1